MKIETIKLSDLQPYEGNAKIHTPEEVLCFIKGSPKDLWTQGGD